MKRQVRLAAFSTGPVDLRRRSMALVLAVARAPDYLEAIAVSEVAVDGEDSTDRMIELLGMVPQADQVHAAFTNATTMAGFNVIDTARFSAETGVPLISMVRDAPDMASLRTALEARFGEAGGGRFAMLSAREWTEVDGPYLTWAGAERDEALGLYRISLLRGKAPEVLRIAHMVATAIETGVSGGRVV